MPDVLCLTHGEVRGVRHEGRWACGHCLAQKEIEEEKPEEPKPTTPQDRIAELEAENAALKEKVSKLEKEAEEQARRRRAEKFVQEMTDPATMEQAKRERMEDFSNHLVEALLKQDKFK